MVCPGSVLLCKFTLHEGGGVCPDSPAPSIDIQSRSTVVANMQALLAELLEYVAGRPLSLQSSSELVVRWLVECDRGEALDGDCNAMHIAGSVLCVALDVHAVPVPVATGDSGLHARLFMSDLDIAGYSVRDIQDFLGNLQTEFNSLYEMSDDGYACHLDVSCILLAVMQRLGHWLRHDIRPNADDLSLHDLADVVPGDGGPGTHWRRLRPDVFRHILDVVHCMLSTHRMLLLAKLLPPCPVTFELHPVHLEASMDSWWELATVADCPVGGITQYKHKFQYLFHSVSQVIYYHYPAYVRRSQAAFTELDHAGAALNVLPLLLQVAPDMPVLYEHTGSGHGPSLAKTPHTWCVVGGFVLLADNSGRFYCARDPRTLLQHTLK